MSWLVDAFRLKKGKKQNKFDSRQNGTSYMFMRGNHKSGVVRYLYLLPHNNPFTIRLLQR